MRDAKRYNLLGTYSTPRFQLGARVKDEVRGKVEIAGISDAPIPWPAGRIRGNHSLVVYGGLARAIRRESIQAVAHWWGVSNQTVVKWRRMLGLTGKQTVGTSKLRSAHFNEPWADIMRLKAWSKADDPKRREKIAAAKRGKRRTPETIAKMRATNLGKKASKATRQSMSAAHRARGTRPPWLNPAWAPWEQALLYSLPPAEVAQRTGRSLPAVYCQRSKSHGR